MSDLTTKQRNQAFFDKLTSDDTGLFKQAENAVNDFTRVKMREDGFARRILPQIPLTDDDLDRSVSTDKPVKIVDKEPDSPAAAMVPFGTLPNARYIRAPRYQVMFARILSPKFYKDVDELRTYEMDVRQIIADNAVKDMLAEEDSKFLGAVNGVLGAVNSTVAETGAVQYQSFSGTLTRNNLVEATKIMPSTGNSLEAKTGLINSITIKDVLKFDRQDAGTISEAMLLKGFTEKVLFGITWVVTIKKTLVPINHLYLFAEPKALGKFFVLEDATMFMDKRAYMIEFFAYSSIGGAIGNVAGCAHVVYTG